MEASVFETPTATIASESLVRLLTRIGMVGKDAEDQRFDQRLGPAVELELDVVRFSGIDVQLALKMTPDHPPRGKRRITGGGE